MNMIIQKMLMIIQKLLSITYLRNYKSKFNAKIYSRSQYLRSAPIPYEF